jgi:dipeptidyl-peptidase-4
MKRKSLLAAALLVAAAPLLAEQQPQEITVEWIYSDAGQAVSKVPKYAWTSGGDVMFLDETKPENERVLERVKASTGERRPAVDRAAALASLKTAVGGPEAPKPLPFPESFDSSGRFAVSVIDDDVYLLDLPASRFERVTRTPAKESIPRLSPDGRKIAFVRDNDLWVYDIASRAERRLTNDGSPTVLNGIPTWLYWEEIFDHGEAGYWWSDDSASIAFLRADESAVDVATFPDFKPAVPEIIHQRYPKAGDANPLVRLGIVAVGSGRTVWMDPQASGWEYILGVTWLPDSSGVGVQTTNRMQTRLDLYLVSRSDGATKLVLTDTDEAWVNQKELQFLDGGKKFLISSERDGWTHLYLYSIDGKLLNAVTHGPWSVRGPSSFYGAPLHSAWVDEAQGWVYFTGREKSPVERHLYRVHLDGTGMERLSKEDGTHTVAFSPDRRFYVDDFSSHDAPPSLSVHDAGGTSRAILAKPRTDLIGPFGFQKAELFTVPAADGLPLQARIIKPAGFDVSKKYPVVVYVYGGPGAPTVKDAWDYSFAGNALLDQVLVRQGYVVFSVDPRSATAQSKKLENTIVRKMMTDSELSDIVSGVKWVKAQPWADPSRVGIWGWSGGGTDTLLLMTRSQEFEAGISIAPVTDWHFYDTKFTETYMKTPADNPEGYAHFSLVPRAKDLHGRLLLVFGTYDDNVHPQNEWAFADALIAAGKRFDLMVYPMRKHPIEDRPARIHLFGKMLEFWKLYL